VKTRADIDTGNDNQKHEQFDSCAIGAMKYDKDGALVRFSLPVLPLPLPSAVKKHRRKHLSVSSLGLFTKITRLEKQHVVLDDQFRLKSGDQHTSNQLFCAVLRATYLEMHSQAFCNKSVISSSTSTSASTSTSTSTSTSACSSKAGTTTGGRTIQQITNVLNAIVHMGFQFVFETKIFDKGGDDHYYYNGYNLMNMKDEHNRNIIFETIKPYISRAKKYARVKEQQQQQNQVKQQP